MNATYETIFLTVHYYCGHHMLRATRRGNISLKDLANKERELYSPDKCQFCDAITAARRERSAGGRL